MRKEGLYCPAGDFYIDPWRGVGRAVVTHAHADHARRGSKAYLCAHVGRSILAERIGQDAKIEGLKYGEKVRLGEAGVSLWPAGHILGSAQVCIEVRGKRLVVSGDYKTQADGSCEPFEPVRCDEFITESTFGLPIYRWAPAEHVVGEVNAWWRGNRERGVTSVIYGYPLGKSQRVLRGLDGSIGPIGVHGSAFRMAELYADAGCEFPPFSRYTLDRRDEFKGSGLIIATGNLQGTAPVKRLAPVAEAFASGWMQVRGIRRGRSFDKGFVISDHADWPGLLGAIKETGATRIGVTHGYVEAMVRYLQEQGYDAYGLKTEFRGEVMGEKPDSGEEAAEPVNRG